MVMEHESPVLSVLRNLQSLDHLQLLDVVDQLRAQGLSNFLPLPQLIVCGDQSSGKSSVLEAISGVPFPKKDNLCTRFATEVILRRNTADDQQVRINVSINPGNERSESDRINLENFEYNITTIDSLPDAIQTAKEAMGLGSIGNAFSTDVLRLEVTGPTMPQLTIVDLPGLIHSETKLQSERDVQLVKELVENYMRQERSIILAIVSAKNDIANQIVLKKAREIDPSGLRTLGIVTKPDFLRSGSEGESNFLELAMNQNIKFSLGWHVVRNLDSNEIEPEGQSRDEHEAEFFRFSNWEKLETSLLGAPALRERLSHVLFNQIRQELPSLIGDIEKNIVAAGAELARLGRSRTSEAEQRLYLIEVSQQFSRLCSAGCDGNTDDRFFGSIDSEEGCHKRIRAIVQNESITFGTQITSSGAKWTVRDSPSRHDSRQITRTQAVDRVMLLLKRNRGRELPGTYNPLLIGHLFREYSSPWKEMCHQHVEHIWRMAKNFVELLIKSMTDADVSQALLRKIIFPGLDHLLSDSIEALENLMTEFERHPITYNHYFTNTAGKIRSQGRERDIISLANQAKENSQNFDLSSLLALIRNQEFEPDMDRLAAEEIFDHMNAYYKVIHYYSKLVDEVRLTKQVSLKRLIDNIPILVLESKIMVKLPNLLSVTKIALMDHTMLDEVVGETEAKQDFRARLTTKLEILRLSEATCKRYASLVSSVSIVPIENGSIDFSTPETMAEPPETSGKNPASGVAESPGLLTSTVQNVEPHYAGSKPADPDYGNPLAAGLTNPDESTTNPSGYEDDWGFFSASSKPKPKKKKGFVFDPEVPRPADE